MDWCIYFKCKIASSCYVTGKYTDVRISMIKFWPTCTVVPCSSVTRRYTVPSSSSHAHLWYSSVFFLSIRRYKVSSICSETGRGTVAFISFVARRILFKIKDSFTF